MGNIATRIDVRGWSAEPRLPVFAIQRVPDADPLELGLGSLVGTGPAMLDIFATIRLLAPTAAPVLIGVPATRRSRPGTQRAGDPLLEAPTLAGY